MALTQAGDGCLIIGHRRWVEGPGERTCVSGGAENCTVKDQRQGFPDTFKKWKDAHLARQKGNLAPALLWGSV